MNKTTMKMGAICLAGMLALNAQANPADKDANVAWWWWQDPATTMEDPAGTSRIVRTDKGISGNISVHLENETGSAKGLAITLWLVIFNNPDYCATKPCSDGDLFNPGVMSDVINGGGNIVGASERATIGFHYKEGDNTGSIATLFNAFGIPFPLNDDGEGFGLIYPRDAEVHYVIRLHGPVNPAAMPAQIQSYGGGCIDFAPFGFPGPGGSDDLKLGLGECQDVIFAINPPP